MKILTFDLSLRNTGWCYGEMDEEGDWKVLESGTIPTGIKQPTGARLERIRKALERLFNEKKIDVVVKEQSFSNVNIRSTQQIFRVVGVFDLTVHELGLPPAVDIAQSTIKKVVTGNGRATKELVQRRVEQKTGINTKTDDESDAIALFITYCMQNGKGGSIYV